MDISIGAYVGNARTTDANHKHQIKRRVPERDVHHISNLRLRMDEGLCYNAPISEQKSQFKYSEQYL